MRQIFVVFFAAGGIFIALASMALAMGKVDKRPRSPIYGVTLPEGYRQWEFIAPAQEAPPLDELRVVVGNVTAMKAYRDGKLPFPDGTVLVKLAWKRAPSSEFAPASVPGAATTVQVMVKDSRRYAATGGWGFGRFINGKSADEAQHRTCYGCHLGNVKDHDLVFTRYAR
ncbi:hypothetical protein FHW69_002784 [Luteibacter sp. Sphag1AF]|uniref:cytochrome P460 family protein n=1 Tax=Luteibacter sp. Sphag1AF TaxID=2587031 RepID=UPI0016139255|nr:cytochrome P460 family protein [Luteibacter sp. Sphag1AF]MBB3228149.1 hypothetical protein [Luteibacter sp. Sphag1AF]